MSALRSWERGLAEAYSRSAAAWAGGPERVYERLASHLVSQGTRPRPGALGLDLGAGTGAGSRALAAMGAAPIALDLAHGMLAHDRLARPPGVQGSATCLPFRAGCFEVVAACFSLNHLDDPVAGLREVRRVLTRGGTLLASVYADDDHHPVKSAVESSLLEVGWQPDGW
ncbi:MAG TPA: class I SAM-dependent methyltransferase, partial [Acidimicrobiales bacterium]